MVIINFTLAMIANMSEVKNNVKKFCINFR